MSTTYIYVPRVLGGTLIIPASPTPIPGVVTTTNINPGFDRDGLGNIAVGRDGGNNISIGRDGGNIIGTSRS